MTDANSGKEKLIEVIHNVQAAIGSLIQTTGDFYVAENAPFQLLLR